ncbi:MAG: hypothetical protein EON94_03490 [Caulobacteraceae bacterium]|nr:MAG: hypothetical protein EON94_03490 [Caulobacteraceae bacterium]
MNVHRHARARSVRVVLRYGVGDVSLQVEDDGVGLPEPSARSVGVGVNGMRDRMVQLHGRLSLEPGVAGLRVVASAPASVTVRSAHRARRRVSDMVDVLKAEPMQGIA